MSSLSNDNGRAFEYVFLLTLDSEIRKHRKVIIRQDSCFFAAQRAWGATGFSIQNNLKQSALAAIRTLFDSEPLILENDGHAILLNIQPDEKGEEGDVRDILISRDNIKWEIGLSLKHNHFAVKHSRLSNSIDFGEKWFGYSCSNQYWKEINPIFHYLNIEKSRNKDWNDLPSKANDVYVPLLNAFVEELKRQCEVHSDVPRKMVEYLLGKFDFYKVISLDSKQMAEIQGYNFRGTLNRASNSIVPKIIIPSCSLPTKILYVGFYEGRNNTIEMCMDGGWCFTFRIHNASTKVEASLKFDVQIIGMPTTIMTINCLWR